MNNTGAPEWARNRHYGHLGEPPTLAMVVTKDHTPEDPLEQ